MTASLAYTDDPEEPMPWVLDDGGRSAAGFKGVASDCVCRAVAIVTRRPYQEVYDTITALAALERPRRRSSARNGVAKPTFRRLLDVFDLTWVPTMRVGSGCTVHLRADELPPGRLVVQLSLHAVAVVDGVAHDLADHSRGGTRCVYGYAFLEE